MHAQWTIAIICDVVICAETALAVHHKAVNTSTPTRSAGALCFSRGGSAGREFYRDLNDESVFHMFATNGQQARRINGLADDCAEKLAQFTKKQKNMIVP
jgi:hypothetical protein